MGKIRPDVAKSLQGGDSVAVVPCPHCREPLEDSGQLAGWTVDCPHCGCRFEMPSAFDRSVGAQRVRRRLYRPRSPLNVQVAMLTATGIALLGLPILGLGFGLGAAGVGAAVYLLALVMLFVLWFAGR